MIVVELGLKWFTKRTSRRTILGKRKSKNGGKKGEEGWSFLRDEGEKDDCNIPNFSKLIVTSSKYRYHA